MDNDFIKEKIKAVTEFLRGLYGLFILIGTGAATLLMRKTFIVYDLDEGIILIYNIDYYIFISAIVFDFIIFILLLIFYYRIHVFIKKLKEL